MSNYHYHLLEILMPTLLDLALGIPAIEQSAHETLATKQSNLETIAIVPPTFELPDPK